MCKLDPGSWRQTKLFTCSFSLAHLGTKIRRYENRKKGSPTASLFLWPLMAAWPLSLNLSKTNLAFLASLQILLNQPYTKTLKVYWRDKSCYPAFPEVFLYSLWKRKSKVSRSDEDCVTSWWPQGIAFGICSQVIIEDPFMPQSPP
jgi:hypothetical protein